MEKKVMVVAINYEGMEFRKEFNSIHSANDFFTKLVNRRETIALYKSIELLVGSRPFIKWMGAISFSQAKEFYRDCLPFWHDGIISAELIAEAFNCPVGRVELLLEACLAWGLPVSKANGMWTF